MVTRRQLLAVLGSGVALAGCSGDESTPTAGQGTSAPPTASPTASPSPTPTSSPTETPSPTDRETETAADGLAAWEPVQTIQTAYPHVVGLNGDEDRLYATLSGDGGPSAVAAFAPGDRSLRWVAEFEGEAIGGTHVHPRRYAESWGVTLADGALYSVHGRADDYEWTAVHAVDPGSGDVRWSVRRERALAVHGALDDIVIAAGEEFFEPEHTHDAPDEPLETIVYGLDAATGDERWTASFDGVDAVAVGARGPYVVTGTDVIALDADGDRRWRTGISEQFRSIAVLDGAVAVALGDDRRDVTLRGLHPDGTDAWSHSLPVRELVPHGDRLYGTGGVVAAVTADGDVDWRADVYGGWPLLTPDGGRLYTRAGIQMAAVDAFDLPGGERRFRYDAPSNNGWPVAATDDTVVAEAITPDEADFTSLFAVDAADGTPRAVYRPSDSVFTALGRGDTVYAGFGDGAIRAFDAGGE